MITNAVTDPTGLRWIADELAAHPDVDISCWVDSMDTVRTMESALHGQHAFLRLAAGAPADALRPGAVVRLGLSHPCTVLDRWRLLPVIDDAEADAPTVVDAVPTRF